MFNSRHEHTVDAKGRLHLPARWKDTILSECGGEIVVTNLKRCLVAFPPEHWRAFEKKAEKFSSLDPNVQDFLRFFYSGACECELDKQGRILIPQTLRSFAGIDRHVTLAGMMNKIEIWAKQRWDEEMLRVAENYDQISQKLADLGM